MNRIRRRSVCVSCSVNSQQTRSAKRDTIQFTEAIYDVESEEDAPKKTGAWKGYDALRSSD